MTHELPHERPDDASTEPPSKARARAMGLMLAYSCAVAALTLAVDLVSKQLALRFLDTETRIPLLGDLFGLQLAFNTGAAFSIGSQLTPIITLLGLVAVVLLVRAAARTRHPAKAVAIGLVLGGALGNLADRIIAPPGFGRGAVTDFLAYGHLFIGNLADVAVFAGVVLYLLTVWRMKSNASRQSRDREPTRGDSTTEPPTVDLATVAALPEVSRP